jgi:hypothetical protein
MIAVSDESSVDAIIMLRDDEADILTTAACFLHERGAVVQTTRVRVQPPMNVARVLRLDVNRFLEGQDTSELGKLQQVMDDGITSKAVAPLPTKMFSRNELPEAFTAANDQELLAKVVVNVSLNSYA